MAEIGVRIQEKGQVTIPRKIREKLNLKRGDLVIFEETDAGVVIKSAKLVAAGDLRTLLISIRERFKDIPDDEIESLVIRAVRETRENHSCSGQYWMPMS